MDKLMDFLTPKAFNRISYVAVICWIIYGVILVAIFAQMENSDSFRCEAKLEKMDLVRGKCSDQYKKQYNKSGIPVYGFVIADFLLIGIVCVIYSQAVKTRVDQVEANRRRADAESHNRPKGRRLFVAYVCQLASRFSIGTAFTVLQTQVLYPDNFPSDFRCQIAGASHAANTSSTGNTQNSTMYQCHSQQATKKTSWMNGVVVGNGVLALIVLIEIICILALRLKKGREFFEDSQFLDYLTPQEPSQDAEVQPLQEPEGQPLQETEEQPLQETEEQHVQETEEEHPEEHIEQQLKPIKFIENQKESIKKNTEKPPDLKALFQVPHGEGERNVDRKIDHIAAKHITDTMKGEELRRFVADHIDKGEWQLVLQFVGGLLGEQSIDIFTDLLPKTTEVKDENELMRDYSDEPRTVTCWPTRSEKHLAVTLMKCINESNESGSVVQLFRSKLEEIGFNAVDFSKCRLAPADCTAVVRFLQSCPQISLINLSLNNIGSLGCVEIVKLFDNVNCKLRGLNLGGNNIGDKGVEELAKALVNNNELRSLDLGKNNIGVKGVEELAKALVNNNKLRSLDLGINNIGDEGVEELAKALVNNNKLRSLVLGSNKIGDKGAEELAKALVNNNKLRSLFLSYNNIGDKGVEELAKVLVNNNELGGLSLIGNNEITNEAKTQIRRAYPNCNVQYEIV